MSFVNYVTYNQYGGVDRSVPKDRLETWLINFEQGGHLALGIWELRRSETHSDAIDVRLAPPYEIDGKDNNWRTWNYTFYPYVI